MPRITTFLTYNNQAAEAAKLYTSIFKNSKVTSTSPGPNGTVMSVTFELDGQPFYALNGGPSFKFAEGISLFVNVETQAEVDEYWSKLTADGGKPGSCGWLTDKFGVSWQIVPSILPKLLGDKDPQRAQRAVQAMLKMKKLDIAALQAAADNH